MKQFLFFAAVFALAFAATLLLSREVFAPRSYEPKNLDGGGGAEAGAGPSAADRQAQINRTMVSRPVVNETPVAAGSSSTPELGDIEGTVKTDDGLEPRNLSVSVFPQGPVANVSGSQFFLTNLAPGDYYVGVAADGYLPRQMVEAKVEAGTKYKVELGLDRGLELAGIVIEDVDQRPIQGVMIDFNGIDQARTDQFGAFRTGIVPPRALDIITLTHDEYDRNVVVHQPIPEPQAIRLAMTRGSGTVSGRVIAPSGEPAPPVLEVRVILVQNETLDVVRRERTFRDTSSFEIKGVFSGPHVLAVSFPGTTLASRRVEFDVGRDAVTAVDVDLTRGGSIEGTYTSPTGLIASIPIVLVDSENHRMGEARTDSEGKFRFDHAAAGDYAIRMDARIPPIFTEAFKVEDGKVTKVTVDARTGRLR